MIKIVKDNQPKQYELTYLLPAVYTSAELKKISSQIEDLVKKFSGKIVATNDWGKRELAYKIKKAGRAHTEAVYTHLVVEFNPAKIEKFKQELQLVEEVLRSLVVMATPETTPLKSVSETESK